MNNSDVYTLFPQLNPYTLKWKWDKTDTAKSFDSRIAGGEDYLGNFWNVGGKLLDINNADVVSLSDCGHPLIKKYWQTKKIPYNETEDDRNVLNKACGKIRYNANKDWFDPFPKYASDLDYMVFSMHKEMPAPEVFTIHIYCSDPDSGKKILDTIHASHPRSTFLEKLRIQLVPESDSGYLDAVEMMTPTPAIIPIAKNGDDYRKIGDIRIFQHHLCFLAPDPEESGYIQVAPRDNNPCVPTYWLPETEDELVELIWQYMDFYYFRWRFSVLWDYYLPKVRFNDYDSAAKFIQLGILTPVAVINEKECQSSIVVNNRIETVWHRVIPAVVIDNIDCPLSVDASCSGHSVKHNEHDKGGTFVVQSGLDDIRRKLEVQVKITSEEPEQKLFVLRSDGSLQRCAGYEYAVLVVDNGYASGIAVKYKGRVENRNGRLCFPDKEQISVSYEVKAHRNGDWLQDKDPVIFTVNDAVREKPFLLPAGKDVFTVKAETAQSKQSDTVTLHRLKRADSIFQNCGQVTRGDYPCNVGYEKNDSGLCAKNKMDKNKGRVSSIRCAENAQFVFDAKGVVQKDLSAEVWNGKCVFQLYNSNGGRCAGDCWDLVVQKSGNVLIQFKRPGNYTLCTSSEDNSDVNYKVDVTVFADHSKKAFIALSVLFALSLISTLAWFGLNVLLFFLYLLCPVVLYFISAHKEGCIRNKIQYCLFYLIAAGYFAIICKVLWEELQ